MRKLSIILSASLAACACMAEPADVQLYVAMGDSTAATQSVENITGVIDAVYVSCGSGAATGVVALAIVPKDGNTSAINLATGTATGSKVWRPSIDRTSVAGSDLSSDPPGRFIVVGDTLRLIVNPGTTGVTWRATIMLDK